MMWNEEDVAEYVVRHMLTECDRVIVADNNSTDFTRSILESIGDERLTITDEPSFAYYQSHTMNRLADMARIDFKADWVVPFDADEVWYSPSWPLKDVLPSLDTGQVKAGEYVFVPRPTDDPTEPNPFRRCVWRRDLVPDFKVAFRPQSGKLLGFGGHIFGADAWEDVARHTLFIRHLPYRSLDQAKRKLRHGKAALEAAGQSKAVGWHWHQYGGWDDEQMANWWNSWTGPAGLTRDPLPGPWALNKSGVPVRGSA